MSPRPHRPQPEIDSIHAILVANPTTRLYTHPLEWKAEQLENLSCVLHAPALSLENGIVDEATQGSQWDEIQGAVAEVQDCGRRKPRDERMRHLVAALSTAATGLPLQSDCLAFLYNKRIVAEIRLPLLFSDQRQAHGPAWAYIDRTWSSEKRYDFHRRRQTPFSYATRAIQGIKDLPIDPLYVAILIALAQKARGAQSPSTSNAPQKVSLFVPEHTTAATTSTDKQCDSSRRHQRLVTSLKQYTATITNEYLQKFDDPCRFYDGALHIHQKSLPIERPSTIYEAMRNASCTQSRQFSSTATKKRKALDDITEGVNTSRRRKTAEEDVNKEQG